MNVRNLLKAYYLLQLLMLFFQNCLNLLLYLFILFLFCRQNFIPKLRILIHYWYKFLCLRFANTLYVFIYFLSKYRMRLPLTYHLSLQHFYYLLWIFLMFYHFLFNCLFEVFKVVDLSLSYFYFCLRKIFCFVSHCYIILLCEFLHLSYGLLMILRIRFVLLHFSYEFFCSDDCCWYTWTRMVV